MFVATQAGCGPACGHCLPLQFQLFACMYIAAARDEVWSVNRTLVVHEWLGLPVGLPASR